MKMLNNKSQFMKVWGMPVLLSIVTIIGLISAIIGLGVWHWISWITLSAPIVVMWWFGRRFFRWRGAFFLELSAGVRQIGCQTPNKRSSQEKWPDSDWQKRGQAPGGTLPLFFLWRRVRSYPRFYLISPLLFWYFSQSFRNQKWLSKSQSYTGPYGPAAMS